MSNSFYIFSNLFFLNKQCENYPFNFLCFHITIIIFITLKSNFTKKRMYGHVCTSTCTCTFFYPIINYMDMREWSARFSMMIWGNGVVAFQWWSQGMECSLVNDDLIEVTHKIRWSGSRTVTCTRAHAAVM